MNAIEVSLVAYGLSVLIGTVVATIVVFWNAEHYNVG
jgi:hypothetical protein